MLAGARCTRTRSGPGGARSSQLGSGDHRPPSPPAPAVGVITGLPSSSGLMDLVSPGSEPSVPLQAVLLHAGSAHVQAQQQLQPPPQASQQGRQEWEHRRQMLVSGEVDGSCCCSAQSLLPQATAASLTENDFGGPPSVTPTAAAAAAAAVARTAMMAGGGPLGSVIPPMPPPGSEADGLPITRNQSVQSGLLESPRVPHLPLQHISQQQQQQLPQPPQPPPSQVQVRRAFTQSPSASSGWLSPAPAACPTAQPPAPSSSMAATAAALADEVAQLRREVEQLRSQRREAVDFDRQALQKLVEVVEAEGGERVRLYETEREERERVTSELRAELQDLRRSVDRDCTTRLPSPVLTQLNHSSPAGSSRLVETPMAVGLPLGAADGSTCEVRTEDGQSARYNPGAGPLPPGLHGAGRGIGELTGLREDIESELRHTMNELRRDCMAAYSTCREEIVALQQQIAPLQEQVRVLFATAANHCQQLQRVEETMGLANTATLVSSALPRQALDAVASTASFATGSLEKVLHAPPMSVDSQLDGAAAPPAADIAAECRHALERTLGPWTERSSRPGVRATRQASKEAPSRSASQRRATARAR